MIFQSVFCQKLVGFYQIWLFWLKSCILHVNTELTMYVTLNSNFLTVEDLRRALWYLYSHLSWAGEKVEKKCPKFGLYSHKIHIKTRLLSFLRIIFDVEFLRICDLKKFMYYERLNWDPFFYYIKSIFSLNNNTWWS